MSRISREPLVDVRKYVPGIRVALDKLRMKAEKTAYLRLSVVKMLARAQKLLPRGYHFVIRDAWRPQFVQAEIYFSFIKDFSHRHPKWSRRRVIKEVDKYVAPWSGKKVSGHMTGGALDVRILDDKGRRLPMRSRSLSYQENSLTDNPKLPAHIRQNRGLLCHVMTAAGFSNYPLEFWHWSYGDPQWARREKKKAIYDVVDMPRNPYQDRKCPCGSGKLFIKCHSA